ncbi:MAG: AAA family ATPase [Bacilli bacterium]|nr:AAA family ATPase [Bacilli bacterium]
MEEQKVTQEPEVFKPSLESFSVIKAYGEDLVDKKYITNPAIAREEEQKKLMLVLLTPEKSGLLVGKPGIGKTAIVEGLAYKIQKGDVPNALKGYHIIKFSSNSLIGTIELNGKKEMLISLLVEELKKLEKVIIFIDEVHTLIGGGENGPMDLANILKPALDRGDVKAIGATTTIEFDTYIVRDRAFLRRFDKIMVEEPDGPSTVKILMGTLPKIENKTGVQFNYTNFIVEELMKSIVSATAEYKRIYGLAAMYPDVSLSVLTNAFSEALYDNRDHVTILDVYNAIKNSKRIYPDSIIKELKNFREKFKLITQDFHITLPEVTIDEIKVEES